MAGALGFSFRRLLLSVVVLGFSILPVSAFHSPNCFKCVFVLRFSSPSGAQRVSKKSERDERAVGLPQDVGGGG